MSPRQQERVPDRFGGLTVKEQQEYERHRQQIHIAYGVSVLGGIGVVAVMCAIIVLAVNGHVDRISPMLNAVGPYLLPLVGGLVAFAFGRSRTVG
jgi:hypothetical protein